MPTCLSGNELTARWYILGFELLNEVIKGLQPYNRKTGQPMPSPETRSKKNSLEVLRRRILGRFTVEESFTSDYLTMYMNRNINKEHAQKEIESLEKEISTAGSSWENYSPSDSEKIHISSVSEVLNYIYRLKDVKAFEKDHNLVPNEPIETTKALEALNGNEILDDVETNKHDQITKEVVDKQDGSPDICFYKDGDIWKIGEKGKEKTFFHLEGFRYIQFLIRRRNSFFKPLEVIHFGSIPEDNAELRFLNKIDIQKIYTTKDLSMYIEMLEKMLMPGMDQDKRDEINDRITNLKKVRNEGLSTYKSKADGARTNLYHNIKTAVNKITSEIPILKEYFEVGKSSTIKSGNSFCYQQENKKLPAEWILDKPS